MRLPHQGLRVVLRDVDYEALITSYAFNAH